MLRPIVTIYEDAELLLRWMRGRAPRLVVVFTGIRRGFGGAPLDEFAGSASQGGEASVLFVSDKRATWFSAPGLWRRTVRLIRGVRNSQGIREVIALGHSMGGYAALLLPRDVTVPRAVAFAPQVTMDADVLEDDRWPDVKARYGRLPERSVADTVGATRTQYYVTACEGAERDRAHLDLLPDLKRVHRFLVPGSRHNAAGVLKEAGILGEVVAAMVRGRRARAARLIGGMRGAAA